MLAVKIFFERLQTFVQHDPSQLVASVKCSAFYLLQTRWSNELLETAVFEAATTDRLESALFLEYRPSQIAATAKRAGFQSRDAVRDSDLL